MTTAINDTLLRMHGNPNSIQYRMLTGLESDVGNGLVITTPCNVASYLIEAFASESSDIVQDISNGLVMLDANQAQTAEDLFRHMSDMDYVGWFGQPATTNVEMVFLLETLMEAAEADASGNYDKVVIPRYSEFTVAGKVFSTYYPIEIRLRTKADAIPSSVSVVYDDSYTNPLFTLSDTTLEYQLSKQDGQDVLAITIPVYQFVRKTSKYEVFTGAPFIKNISYDNQFYAIRVYTDTTYDGISTIAINGNTKSADTYVDRYGKTWTELGQLLESNVYDVNQNVIPSVVVQPDIANNTVKVTIPQVFLTEDRLGDNITVEVFTTSGALEMVVDVTTEVAATFPFTLNDALDKYHKALFRTENVHVFPLEDQIIGGSDGISFSDLRNRVVYNTDGGSVINSPEELQNLLQENGFTVKRFKDGITNRIYLCNRDLTMDGVNIPAGLIRTKIVLTEGVSVPGIIKHDDGACTLTPATLYEYNTVNGICVPLGSTHPLHADNPSNSDIISLHNENIFTFSPFHIQLDSISNTSLATSYDFTSPKISWVTVLSDSSTIDKVSMLGGTVTHDQANRQFIIRLYAEEPSTSNEMVDGSFKMRLFLSGANGKVELVSDEYTNGYFEFKIDTTYHVDRNQQVELSVGTDTYVSLTSVATCTLECYVTDSDTGSNTRVYSQYQFNLKLGERLNNLFNTVEVTTTERNPLTYEADVLATYDSNVYERDPVDGTIICEVVDNVPVFNKLHSKGDVIYTEIEGVSITLDNLHEYTGSTCVDYPSTLIDSADVIAEWGIPGVYTIQKPTKLHYAGDPVLDNLGNPTYETRSVEYYINMIQIGNKIRYHARPEYENSTVMDTLRTLVRGYCAQVDALQDRMLQNTEAYYQPKRSIGTAACWASAPYSELYDLEISVALRLHVARRIVLDTDSTLTEGETRVSIREDVIELLDAMLLKGYCSLTELAKSILEQFSGVVESVDILGINGDSNVQTLRPVDSEFNLSLAHRLVVDENQQVTTERALDIEFVSSSVDSVAS